MSQLLAAGTTKLLSGPDLPQLIDAVNAQLDRSDEVGESTPHAAAVALNFLRLLSKLLGARKRPKDWKCVAYFDRVCDVLQVSVALLRRFWWQAASGTDTEATSATTLVGRILEDEQLLHQVADAMREVAQLLSAHAKQQQKQQPQQREQLQQLTVLATQLLHWRYEGAELWLTSSVTRHAAKPLHAVAGVQEGADLLLALLQTTSERTASAGAFVLAAAACSVCSSLLLAKNAGPTRHEAAVVAAMLQCRQQPSILRLVLALVVALACSMQHSGSSSGDGGGSGGGGGDTVSSNDTDSSSSNSASPPPLLLLPHHHHHHQQQQLAVAALQLWHAAGFTSAVLPAFMHGLQKTVKFGLPRMTLFALSSGYTASTLPCETFPIQNAFVLVLQLFADVVSGHTSSWDGSGSRSGAAGKAAEGLSRNQQQKQQQQKQQLSMLLHNVVAPLPALLLQSALLAVLGDTPLTDSVVRAASAAVRTWGGLAGDPTAATAAAANVAAAEGDKRAAQVTGYSSSSSLQCLPLQLEPVLDAWLLLVQQHALQLVQQARCVGQTATDVNAAAGGPAAEAAAPATEAERALVATLNSLTGLGQLLHHLQEVLALVVWSRKLPAVLLVFDALHRWLLQCHDACCSSGSVGSSDSSCNRDTTANHVHWQWYSLSEVLMQFCQNKHGQAYSHKAVLFCQCAEHLQEQQQPEQHQLLLQQTFALCISRLKLAAVLRRRGSVAAAQYYYEIKTTTALAYSAAQQQRYWLPPAASLSEVRVLLAPWVLLMGLLLRAAGAQLHFACGVAEARLQPQDDALSAKGSSSSLSSSQPARDVAARANPLWVYDAADLLAKIAIAVLSALDECAPLWAGCNGSDAQDAAGSDSGGGASSSSTAATANSSSTATTANSSSLDSSSSPAGNASSSSKPDAATRQQQHDSVSDCAAAGDQDQPADAPQQQPSVVGQQQRLSDLARAAVAATSNITNTQMYGDLREEFAVAQQKGEGSLGCSMELLTQAALVVKQRVLQLPGAPSNSLSCVFIAPQYDNSASLDALQEACAAADSATECLQHFLACTKLHTLAAQLVEVGSRLCAQLPVPWLCNNVDCTNMAGVCELQLVGGKGKVCGGCMTARYCSKACQESHWQQHQPVCRRIKAAAAATDAAG